MTYKDNPDFVAVYTHEPTGITFYTPNEIFGYHKSRELAMQIQDTYSRCGISKEVLQSFTDTMLQHANKQLNADTLRTDIGVIANNIKYRMTTIVDQHCAIRMGALACLMDGEPHDKVIEAWTEKKIRIANEQPDVYDFFLHMGIAFTPEYAEALRGLTAREYFQQRDQVLNGLTAISILKPLPMKSEMAYSNQHLSEAKGTNVMPTT